MDRTEFDRWVELHYTELLKVARRRTNTPEAAEDAVQTAVAMLLGSQGFLSSPATYAWPRAAKAVRQAASNARRGGHRLAGLRRAQRAVDRIFRPAGALHGWKRPATRAE